MSLGGPGLEEVSTDDPSLRLTVCFLFFFAGACKKTKVRSKVTLM